MRIVAVFFPFLLAGLFVALTNPFKLPLVLLVVPFLLVGIGIFMLGFRVLLIVRVTKGRAKLIAGLAAGMFVLAALLQSIGQLDFKSLILIAVIFCGLAFYMKRLNA